MLLDSSSFSVDLPARWEGAVRAGEVSESVRRRAAERGLEVHTPPVLHLTSATLPPGRGDFGSGAVDLLGEDDVFVAVVEYGPESLGTPLFQTGPLPRRLRGADFRPDGLQRAIPGQAGFQRFCTEQGRALCLYVVLGAAWNARRLASAATGTLSRVRVRSA